MNENRFEKGEITQKCRSNMEKLTLLYISLSGNTKNFIDRISKPLSSEYDLKIMDMKQMVKDNDYHDLDSKTVVFIPTYLEGGNGIDNGDVEILTTPLREYLRTQDTDQYLIGIVGSGNKNFNHQYCLTAKQYSEEFGKPMLADFELRGTPVDLERIVEIIKQMMES